MIELSRDISFGQYINNGSMLARMDPRAKLVCAVLLIALVSYVNTFTAFGLCLLICIGVQWLSRISLAYVLRSFRAIVVFMVFIYIIEIIFYYPPPTQHVSMIWQWGIFNISHEGIIFSTLIMIRVLFLYYLASMLMFTTSLIDLTDGSEVLLSPLQKIGIPVNAFVMVLVIAFKFVPIFVAEVERLIKAQSARGVRFDQGNLFKRAMKLGPLLIPLFISGFRRAETLSVAMEARCYGGAIRGWRRSKRRELRFQRFDVLALLCTVIFCAITVVVNLLVLY
jgi:energy-coupling factor transport system permease protein